MKIQFTFLRSNDPLVYSMRTEDGLCKPHKKILAVKLKIQAYVEFEISNCFLQNFSKLKHFNESRHFLFAASFGIWFIIVVVICNNTLGPINTFIPVLNQLLNII